MRVNKETNIWFTVYADLMTNLALFFLAAFSLARMDKAVQAKAGESFRTEITGKTFTPVVRIDTLKESSVPLPSSNVSKIEITEKRIKITLPGEVLFMSGSSELSESMKRNLATIAPILMKTNNPIIVEGFTDDVPMHRGSNWELSLSRAVSVAGYLEQSLGIPRNRFMVAGYGEYKPIVPNTTDENRRKNRRIEITVVRHE